VKLVKVFILIGFLVFSFGTGWAADFNAMLTKAKTEKKVVMLELGSVGCVPCDQMRPVMDKLTQNYKGKLEVIFVDVRKNTEPARHFRVFGIPTQVFLDSDGKEFHRHIGYYDYDSIVPVLKKAGI
jgi:thioredoxin 1